MNLSTRARYGTRAMVELAVRGGDNPVQVDEIAKRQEISHMYLGQLLHTLRKAGLVMSVRGARGGYVLARPPSTISVMDIVRVLERTITPVYCVDQPTYCRRVNVCPTRGLWAKLKQAIRNTLEQTTLEELAGEQKRRRRTPVTVRRIRRKEKK